MGYGSPKAPTLGASALSLLAMTESGDRPAIFRPSLRIWTPPFSQVRY